MTGRSLDLLFLSADDIGSLDLQPAEVLDAVEQGLRAHGLGEVVMPPKDHLSVEEQFQGHFNILKAYVPAFGFAGVKVIGDYVNNYRHDLPSELALLTLYQARDGHARGDHGCHRADLDAHRRRHRPRRQASGAPRPARCSATSARAAPPGTTSATSTTCSTSTRSASPAGGPESRERFAAEMSGVLGKQVVAVADVETAVAGADIVVDASRLSEERTILENRWLEPGALVMPYGAVRSTDPQLPLIADRFVVDDWRQAAGSEHGQYFTLIRDGRLTRDDVYAEIGEIVAGAKPGRERDDQLIVFWHRGFAISDIAVGSLALRRAQELGLGTRVAMASDVRES